MPDAGESKEDRFKRLASKRVNEAIKRMSLVGKLSNRSSYAYSDEQVQQIITAMRNEINKIEEAFARTRGADKSQFQL